MKKPFSSDDGVSRYSKSEKTAKKKQKKFNLNLKQRIKWLVSVIFPIQAISFIFVSFGLRLVRQPQIIYTGESVFDSCLITKNTERYITSTNSTKINVDCVVPLMQQVSYTPWRNTEER